jgi:rhamnosyltransferase
MSLLILLSTYNGEKYLPDLLDSLLAQTYRNFSILVRDDGSRDATREILAKYKSAHNDKFQLNFEENVGVIKSFLSLINLAPSTYDYYAFCDQDDFWCPEKTQTAVSALESDKSFLTYCSNLKLVDNNLNDLGDKYSGHIRFSFGLSFFENFMAGCTIVFKASLLQRLKGKYAQIDPDSLIMYDWLIDMVSTAFGKVIYDGTPHILYRQHEGNCVGLASTKIGEIVWRVKNKIKNKHKTMAQVRHFLELFGEDINVEQKEYLKKLLNSSNSFMKRLKFAITQDIPRQKLIESLYTRILYILNYL